MRGMPGVIHQTMDINEASPTQALIMFIKRHIEYQQKITCLLRTGDSKISVREIFTNTLCDAVSLSVVHY